ncbi:MAG: hypothetical protein AAGH48_05755 [Pseudomonadota bacterium]
MESLWRAHDADAVLIENKASGKQLIREQRHHGPFRPIPIAQLARCTRRRLMTVFARQPSGLGCI